MEITTPEVTRALRIARQIPGIRSATIFGQSIHALIDDHFDLNDLREQLLKNGIVVAEIRPLAPSLEDVFVELTYKNQARRRRRPCVNPFRGFGAVFYKETLHVRRDFGDAVFLADHSAAANVAAGFRHRHQRPADQYRGLQCRRPAAKAANCWTG